MISGVSPIASASTMNVGAILAILNLQLIPSLISMRILRMVCTPFLSHL
jgi:hypothetical protein